jgi:PKHD-type hydroxylase
MHTILEEVMSRDEIAQLKELILKQSFEDGRATSALASKNNLQLAFDSATSRSAGQWVIQKLCEHPLFTRAVQPAAIHPVLFSRYDVGMQYPDHVDVALMAGLRTDVAITLFLNELDQYEGGELVTDTGNGVRRYRLPPGHAIVYPASSVHHVSKVTRGQRLAAVLWVQSCVRDPLRRSILFELDRAARALADTQCGARLSRSYWNLLRIWADAQPGSCSSPT